jgi:hypothetical protein
MSRSSGFVVSVVALVSSASRESAAQAPQPYPPQPPPGQPVGQPPPLPAAPAEKREWYGYQELIGVSVFALLGVWNANADLEAGEHVGLGSVILIGGMLSGPGVHFVNGVRSQSKLRRSAQFVSGGALAGFLVGIGFELANREQMEDPEDPSANDINWPAVGTAMFVGMALGGAIDGIFFASKAPKAEYPPRYSFQLTPLRDGGTALGFGGRF